MKGNDKVMSIENLVLALSKRNRELLTENLDLKKYLNEITREKISDELVSEIFMEGYEISQKNTKKFVLETLLNRVNEMVDCGHSLYDIQMTIFQEWRSSL